MMKKFASILLILAVIIAPLSLFGCSTADDGKITVVCTVFPIYDWARSIACESDTVNVVLLIKNGSDPHSYQPTAEDVLTVRDAELMIRLGGESDGFVEELMRGADSTADMKLMEAEGVTLRHMSKESHSHEGEEHHHQNDEHIWLSLKNAAACVTEITEALCELSPNESESFRNNAEEYKQRLSALDLAYEAEVAKHQEPRIIFADRFPFVYMTEDYGIEYCAAFEGCTTEAEASFDTVLSLGDRLDRWSTGCLAVTESADTRLAQRIIQSSSSKDVEIVVFDSMQKVDVSSINAGATYLTIMEKNLTSLSKALGA